MSPTANYSTRTDTHTRFTISINPKVAFILEQEAQKRKQHKSTIVEEALIKFMDIKLPKSKSVEKESGIHKYLSVRDLADILGMSQKGVRDLIFKHGLPASKIGKAYRVLDSDFESFFNANMA